MNTFRAWCGGVAAAWLPLAVFANNLTVGTVQDSMVTEQFPGTPQGTNIVMIAGTNGQDEDSRSLLAFNLAAIPSNAVVTSAALTVKVVKLAPGFPSSGKMDLHRLLVPWGDAAATWTNRLAGVHWSTNGAAAPVDFTNAVTQQITVSSQTAYTFVSNSNMVADVQRWVSNPGTNFGWILISELQGTLFSECKFGTREDPANAPSLTVQYTVPANPPTLTPLPISTNQFRFSFAAETNRVYFIEFLGVLTDTNWTALSTIGPLTIATNVVFSETLTGSNRFYRVSTP